MSWLIKQDDLSDAGMEELARWMTAHIDNCGAYVDVVRKYRWTPNHCLTDPAAPYDRNGPPPPPSPPADLRSRVPGLEVTPTTAPFEREFGLVVRQKRERLGLSPKALAKRAGHGIRAHDVPALEEGRLSLSVIWLCVICRALKCTPSRIIAQIDKKIRSKQPC